MKTSRLCSCILFVFGVRAMIAAASAAEGPGDVQGPVALPSEIAALPVEQAVLTAPPRVPPPIARKTPARVVVRLEVREVVARLADGVEYTFWTFGGTVPGSFIRIREGDVVEFHLDNHPSSKLPHNIDRDLYAWLARPVPATSPEVSSARANFFGVRGLHGLVWEWVDDFNTAMVTGESRADTGLDRDLFCGAGSLGAGDTSDYAAFMRQALRSSLKANNTTSSLGFRCARDVPSPTIFP